MNLQQLLGESRKIGWRTGRQWQCLYGAGVIMSVFETWLTEVTTANISNKMMAKGQKPAPWGYIL